MPDHPTLKEQLLKACTSHYGALDENSLIRGHIALQIASAEIERRTNLLILALRNAKKDIQPSSFRSYREIQEDIGVAIAEEMAERDRNA